MMLKARAIAVFGAVFTLAGVAKGQHAVTVEDFSNVPCVAGLCCPGPETDILGASDADTTNFDDDAEITGFVTVGFGPLVMIDGPGDDLRIWLIEVEGVESFDVLGSENGTDFELIAHETRTNLSPVPFSWDYDLQGTGLSAVRYVKVLNTGSRPSGDGGTCYGPDIDAFDLLNSASNIPTTSNWGMLALFLSILTAGTLITMRQIRSPGAVRSSLKSGRL